MSEPLAAAEFRKKREGFVSLGGAYAEPADPDVARMSKIVRSTMTRLHAELMRSISHYRAQQQGARRSGFFCAAEREHAVHARVFPGKIAITDRVLQSAAQRRRRESAGCGASHRKSAHLLGELVGLALRGTTTCPMELNLAPASVVRARELTKRRPFLIWPRRVWFSGC